MLQEGKIDTAEAARLLRALESNPEPEPQTKPTGKPRHLHIKVTRLADDKPVADIKVPIALVNAGIRLGAKFSPSYYGVDEEALEELLRSPETQQVIDVSDEESGDHVQIWLE
jgi:hypothetical protein